MGIDGPISEGSDIASALGVDHLVLRVQRPDFAHADAVSAIEMVGKRVIPALR